MTENEPLNQNDAAKAQIVSAGEQKVPTRQRTQQTNGASNHKAHQNGAANGQASHSATDAEVHILIQEKEPPDGGMRAWMVMMSAFICNGIIFGIINTYGVIHSELTDRLTEQGDTEANSKAALVGSLTIGTTFLLSPVAGCLADKVGLRLTTFIGGLFSAGGLMLSSFYTQNISALYVTYGVMFGIGAALVYTPTIAILGHYFKRYLGKVSGFVTAGSSVFTVIFAPALNYMVKDRGLESTLQVMSIISCFIILCSYVIKPLQLPPVRLVKKPGSSRFNKLIRSVVNVDIWKRKRYVIWTMCVPLALFGYFVPYVHMVKFVQTVFPGKSENLPVMCIGVTSGIGRLIFGALADIPGVNRILLQQMSLFFIGVATLFLPLTSSYIVLIAFALFMGLFDGCFISLMGPIANELCGASGATQGIGFLLGLSSLPLTVGPPIAGKMFDLTGSYTTPFIVSGIPPIVGAAVMFLIRCVRDNGAAANGIEGNVTVAENTESECKHSAPLMNGLTNEINKPIQPEANGRARLADTESL